MSGVANCKDFRMSGYRQVSISVKRILVAPFFVAGPDIGDTIPVSGRTRVATFIAAVSSHFWKGGGLPGSKQMDRQSFSCRAMAFPWRSRRLMPQRKSSIRSCGS
jgi:hypothetical protein